MPITGACAEGAAEPPTVGADGVARPAVPRSDQSLGPDAGPMFGALIKLAATILKVPIATVSFAGIDNQWFKLRYGIDVPETPDDLALFCGHVVNAKAPFVVPDILQDGRFPDSLLAAGDPLTRFCAGAPLQTPDGFILGAFCVFDHEPRQLTDAEVEVLALLSSQAVQMLELQRRHTLIDSNVTLDLLCTVNSSLNAARDISSYQHADKADKLKSEFVSTVSHELRTPLTTIRGALGLVAKGITGPLPQQAQEYVDIALANSERLIRLINDILDVDKIQTGSVGLNIRPVDLASIIEKSVEENRAFTGSLNVTLSFVEELPDIEVLVDEERLIQVLTNLISNAAEFSTAGQSVEVSMVKKGALVRVKVCDHGRGISDEFRARIFQRFAQEDSSDTRRKGGTGLGLHISKALIEGMNGKIGFESSPSRETTFFFDLPFNSAVHEIAVRSEKDSINAHIRVLYVEDDQDLQQIVKRLLPEDWAVTDATTVADASALLGGEPFDLVLLDLTLPDGRGETLLDQVGAAQVVIFSASEAEPTIARQVTSALVKSRTTEFQLRDYVLALMAKQPDPRRTA